MPKIMRDMGLIDGRRLRNGALYEVLERKPLEECKTAADFGSSKVIGHELYGRLSNGETVQTFVAQDWQLTRRPSGRVLLLLQSEAR